MADEQYIPLSVLRSYSPHPDKLDLTGLTQEEITHGIKSSKLPDYIRYKQYLTDTNEALAQLAEMIIQFAVNLGLDPDQTLDWARKLQQAVPQSEFDSWIATLLDGGPSIFVNTLSELQAKYPNGAAGVALVRETDPAKIYVWNGTAWEDFGDYQGVEVKDGTITTNKLVDESVTAEKLLDTTSYSLSANMFDKTAVREGGYYDATTGNWVSTNGYLSTPFIRVEEKKKYHRTFLWAHVTFWDENLNYLDGYEDNAQLITTPANTNFVAISLPLGTEQTFMFSEAGKLPASYTPYAPAYITGNSWKADEGSRDPIELFGVQRYPAGINLFDKNDTLRGGFFRASDGQWQISTELESSKFIEIKPTETYRKKPKWSEITFWDENFQFISGVGATYGFKTPENAKYVTLSVTPSYLYNYMLTHENDWRGGADWSGGYIPFESGYKLEDKWMESRAIKKIESKRDTSDLFLRVPTPYWDGTDDDWSNHQATHPSVVQFDEPWNGYKYWMAFTPYPHNNELQENPCVVASNDGIKWESPLFLVNPIYDTPSNGYNSDTHIFYNSDTGRVEVWWRETTRVSGQHIERILRKIIGNGSLSPTAEEMVKHTHDQWELYLLSPSIIYEEGQYKMWFTRQAPNFYKYLYYMTSVDGKNWSEPVIVQSNGTNLICWHASVTKHNGTLHLLNYDDVASKTIKYTKSIDGSDTNFEAETVIIESKREPWALDGKTLYRATPVFTDYGVMVIYGALSNGGDNVLKVQYGKNFENLEPLPAKAFDFYNAW